MLKGILNRLVSPVTPEAFTEEAVRLIEKMGASSRVETTGPLDVKVFKVGEIDPLQMHLGNAYGMYLSNRSERKAVLERYVRSMLTVELELLLPKDIIPTIKDKGYVPEMRQHFAAKGGKPEEYFVEEDYNETLSVVYAVDSADSIRYLNPGDLPELNLQGQTLRELALDNLKRVLPAVEVLGEPPLFALKAGGMFESSLLLLERVWSKAELRIEGDIVVAAPSRETLLVADGNSPEAMKQIRQVARKIASNAPYRLTDRLFVRRGAKFELLPD